MDSRFPTYYLNDRRVLKLPDSAFRLLVNATAWSVSNLTDGQIDADDLGLIPQATEEQAASLVRAGLWSVTDTGWAIDNYLQTQTSAAQMRGLEYKRAQDAARAKAYRDKKKQSRRNPDEDHSSRDDPYDDHVTKSRDDKGKAEAEARQGKGKALEHQVPQSKPSVVPTGEICVECDSLADSPLDPLRCKPHALARDRMAQKAWAR